MSFASMSGVGEAEASGAGAGERHATNHGLFLDLAVVFASG